MSPNALTVAAAITKGPIRNLGGMLQDDNMEKLHTKGNKYSMSVIEFKNAIDEINKLIKNGSIRRIDAGGSPTWALVDN